MNGASEEKVIIGRCPACDTRIRFTNPPQLYQLVRCPECEQVLEVKSEQPLRLAWSSEESATESADW